MKRFLYRTLVAFASCAALIGWASFSSAADVKLTAPAIEIPIPNVTLTDAVTGDSGVTIPWLSQYIAGIYTFALSVVGLVAAAMMMVGGFQYLTAGGDNGRVQAGKKRITDALIGLVIAFGSYALLYTINPDLVKFKALQLADVSYIPLEGFNDVALDADTVPEQTSSTAAPQEIGKVGTPTRICDSVATCLPYCDKAGCTKVFCTKKEIADGGSSDCVNSTAASDCDWNGFPVIKAYDIISANSPDLIPASLWPVMKNVKVRSKSIKATKLVVDGLQRASQYLDDHYSGQGYSITISNCWRDYREDFSHQCTVIKRPSSNNPTNWGSTWPGANPHASGVACDLALLKDGNVISGDKSDQTCSSKGPADKLLVEMLTNSTVGAKRLNYESWHFNWGNFSSCFCAMGECDAHLYPVYSGSRKCYDSVQPKSC